MSRTKIIATYGPACESPAAIRAMLRAGADVIRLNVSHLDPAALGPAVKRLRRIAAAARLPLAILADMPGPKVRCTACEPERFTLRVGDRVAVSARRVASTPREIAIQYPHLLDDVKVGHELAINDGLVLLRATAVDKRAGVLRCVVLRGGEVASHKGVSFLHSRLRIRGLTARDRDGIVAAARAGADFIALSFVRSPDDLAAARRILRRSGRSDLPLVAKIEQREALERFDAILAASDGIMVARGDMGIEEPLEKVPLLQKDIIARCNETGRFVITATQMLESMTENALPTRAEVSDVANAILDGTDAVMLSAETATGRNAVAAVETMARIALEAETRIDHASYLRLYRPGDDGVDLDDALAHAACQLALDASLDALVCFSFHGTTARRIARYRPRCPVYVLSPDEEQCRRLAATWGVEVIVFPAARPKRGASPAQSAAQSVDRLIAPAIAALRRRKRLAPGRRIALLAGVPLGVPGNTNWLRVVEVRA